VWVSPELPRSPANDVARPRNSPRSPQGSEKHGYRPQVPRNRAGKRAGNFGHVSRIYTTAGLFAGGRPYAAPGTGRPSRISPAKRRIVFGKRPFDLS